MIRINLLPFRVARKKESIRKQISIFLLLIFLTIVALFWYTMLINNQILVVKEKTKQVNHQILKYKKKADRVAKIKKNLKILEEKLEIVSSLKKQRGKQLILFDSMTDLIVPERMWLESFKTNKNSVTIKGIAFDNPTIADFMEKLENSSIFGKVDLKTAKIKIFKDGVMLKSFELLCSKEKPKEEKQEKSK
ncbi:MAG: pilus assembly protein PilN [Desulfobacula sp.]|jgi:type IV pilus assembly protein PilN|nr:pilus assembly protein PilN [Desulfobacula sp.]MBT6341285.1 pilus assembly protein PilN [Desulfobacula sp.]